MQRTAVTATRLPWPLCLQQRWRSRPFWWFQASGRGMRDAACHDAHTLSQRCAATLRGRDFAQLPSEIGAACGSVGTAERASACAEDWSAQYVCSQCSGPQGRTATACDVVTRCFALTHSQQPTACRDGVCRQHLETVYHEPMLPNHQLARPMRGCPAACSGGTMGCDSLCVPMPPGMQVLNAQQALHRITMAMRTCSQNSPD